MDHRPYIGQTGSAFYNCTVLKPGLNFFRKKEDLNTMQLNENFISPQCMNARNISMRCINYIKFDHRPVQMNGEDRVFDLYCGFVVTPLQAEPDYVHF